MNHKYGIGTLVYLPEECLGVVVHIYENKHVRSKYVVEWSCRNYYRSYTEFEIDELVANLQTKLDTM